MAHKPKSRSCILVCTYLLVMASGHDTFSCCRRALSNGSCSFELSERPDPGCDTQWSADGVAVVDESGDVDESRVHHAAPQSIILRGKHTRVVFLMDCPSKKSVELDCAVLCGSSEELSAATEQSQHTGRPKNTGKRSTSHSIFIFLSIIIFIYVT